MSEEVDQALHQAIVDLTGMGDFDVCRIMFDFIDRNLIAPVEHPTEAAAEVELVDAGAPATSGLGGLLVAVSLFWNGHLRHKAVCGACACPVHPA